MASRCGGERLSTGADRVDSQMGVMEWERVSSPLATDLQTNCAPREVFAV